MFLIKNIKNYSSYKANVALKIKKNSSGSVAAAAAAAAWCRAGVGVAVLGLSQSRLLPTVLTHTTDDTTQHISEHREN